MQGWLMMLWICTLKASGEFKVQNSPLVQTMVGHRKHINYKYVTVSLIRRGADEGKRCGTPQFLYFNHLK